MLDAARVDSSPYMIVPLPVSASRALLASPAPAAGNVVDPCFKATARTVVATRNPGWHGRPPIIVFHESCAGHGYPTVACALNVILCVVGKRTRVAHQVPRPGVTQAALARDCPCRRLRARRERQFRGSVGAGSGWNRESDRGNASNCRPARRAWPPGHDRRHGNRSRFRLRARHPDLPVLGPHGRDVRNIGIDRRSRRGSPRMRRRSGRRCGRAAGHGDAAGERAARERPARRATSTQSGASSRSGGLAP